MQTGSIADYNAAFRQLMIQLTDLSFAKVKFEYLCSLNKHIHDLVQTQKENLTDIRNLQLTCLQLDTHCKSTMKPRWISTKDVAVAEDMVVMLVYPQHVI